MAGRSSARRNCFARNISARSKTIVSSNWPRRFPAPAPTPLANSPKSTRPSSSPASSKSAPAGLYHNTAAIIETDGSIKGIYRKMHIPDDPLFYEKFYFTPGDTGFRAWDTTHGKIGVLICWDQWYPEGARLTALQGRRDPFLSHRHRLASQRKGRVWPCPARQLGTDPAVPCRRQRLLRLRAQPHRPGKDPRCHWQAGERRGHRILGPIVCRIAQWASGGQGDRRTRRRC